MSRSSIECRAAQLRQEVMAHVKQQNPEAKNARDHLHAKYAAEYLNYTYQERPDLDVELRLVDESTVKKVGVITGLLDRDRRLLAVSDRFSPAEKRFSGWHELGHLVLHESIPKLHRDRLPKGRRNSKPRIELEADWFAVAYGMPRKWIRNDVNTKFGEVPIKVNQDLYWWLDRDNPDHFQYPSADELDLEKSIASCTNIGNGAFASLADEYKISAAAMALRLKELNLIESE